MGWYTQVLFPRLCDLLLNRPSVARHRRELLACANGEVLEIGFGTGLNLTYYPEGMCKLTTVEPNAGMHSLASSPVIRRVTELHPRLVRRERLAKMRLA